MTLPIIIDLAYIASAVFFIFGLKLLSKVRTARRGNSLAALAMLVAVGATLLDQGILNYKMILVGIVVGSLIGAVMSRVVQMTAMPQLVAIFNGFGGLASALVAWSEYSRLGAVSEGFGLSIIAASVFVGMLTFTGSAIAFGKLQGIVWQQPVVYPLQKTFNLILMLAIIACGILLVLNPADGKFFFIILGVSSLLGILLVLPIGGADMPVVISLLNSYSGVAASLTGFVLMNKVLIVAGSLVGATGIILTQIMCKAMNRSLTNVAFGAFGKTEEGGSNSGGAANEYTGIKSCSAEEAAMIMETAQLVLIVPGYGLAVSRAQHAIKELAEVIEGRGGKVKYAIHPVAGRMPGHMNVLLAEADVPYEQLYELDQINSEFEQADVALVIGANDVTNPAARNEKGSPIYGMPILNVDKARTTIVIKRSLSAGFAGIKNPLFENEATLMLFSDAKGAVEQITKELRNS